MSLNYLVIKICITNFVNTYRCGILANRFLGLIFEFIGHMFKQKSKIREYLELLEDTRCVGMKDNLSFDLRYF